MNFLIFPLELVLLVFIVILYFVAWRELNAKAVQRQSPAVAELKELRKAVEQLIASLEEQVAQSEARLKALIDEAEKVASAPAPVAISETVVEQALPAASNPDPGTAPDAPIAPDEPLSDKPDPYQRVYALFDDGITDHGEIARMSGLGVAEVMLVLSLRPR